MIAKNIILPNETRIVADTDKDEWVVTWGYLVRYFETFEKAWDEAQKIEQILRDGRYKNIRERQ